MFCKNCGANLPEGKLICDNCGASQINEQPQQNPAAQPVYQTPVQPQYPQQPMYQQYPQQPVYPQYRPQPVYQPPMQPQRRHSDPVSVSKKTFMKEYASSGTKSKNTFVTVTFVLTLLLLIASVIVPLVTPFYKIPVVSTILAIDGTTPADITSGLKGLVTELEIALRIDNVASEEERNATIACLNSMRTMVETPSVINVRSTLSVFKSEVAPLLGADDLRTAGELMTLMDVVIYILLGMFLLPLIFTLLGGLRKSAGLTVAAMIFTGITQLFFSGFLFVVLSLILNIIQIVLCSSVKKAYRIFRTTGVY